jgi:hypothetical protein
MDLFSMTMASVILGFAPGESAPSHVWAMLPRQLQPGVTAIGKLCLPDPRIPAPYPLNIVLVSGDQTIVVRLAYSVRWADLKKLDGKKVIVKGELGSGPKNILELDSPRVPVIFATDVKAAAKSDKEGIQVKSLRGALPDC